MSRRHARGRVVNRSGFNNRARFFNTAPAVAPPAPVRAAAPERPGRPVAGTPAVTTGKSWYRITNYVGGPNRAEVLIYDEIGWFGVTASQFVSDLQYLDVEYLDVRINSPGGDVFDAIAIYNALLAYPGTVTVYIDGLAASAASFIAMAGQTRYIARNASMMIHDAIGFCAGNAAEMTEMATLLEASSDNIADIYSVRCGGTKASWRKAMRAETWYMSGADAVGAGLADQVYEPASDGQDTRARAASTARPAATAPVAPAALAEPPAVPAAPQLPEPEPVEDEPADEPAEPEAPVTEPPTVVEPEPEPAPPPPPVMPPVVEFDPELLRGAFAASLDPMPGFDPGYFRDVMAGVAGDAPAEPALNRPAAVSSEPAVPPREPEPEIAEDPWALVLRGAMDLIAEDAPAVPEPLRPEPPPEPPTPAPVAEEPSEPDPQAVFAGLFRGAMQLAANNASAPPPVPTIPGPAVAEPDFPAIDRSLFVNALREAQL
ncbi:hypothetical protein GCM10027258_62440 [Amycolatopsis stemonae]